jgi:hypothetical protein
MGDRKSHKEEGGHARKIVANALAAPESLKDEILLQICKQVTNHPILYVSLDLPSLVDKSKCH